MTTPLTLLVLTVVVCDDAGDVGVQEAVQRLGAVPVPVPWQAIAARQTPAVDLTGDAAVLVQAVPAQTEGGRDRVRR